MTGQVLLAMDGIACRRGGRLLFEGLDLRLAVGGALVVTGPNGAGKSSLLRLAAGLLAPAAGTVRVGGRVAWMGEAAALDPELPLAKALGFWAKLDGAGPDAGAAALAAVGLTALHDVPVRLLSTGQRRRAALARVVASGAALWLLDEPANGLDVAAVAVLEGLIAAHRDGGGAVVVTTHLGLRVEGADELALSLLPENDFHPGAGRGPAAVGHGVEGRASTTGVSQPGPGLRRGGE